MTGDPITVVEALSGSESSLDSSRTGEGGLDRSSTASVSSAFSSTLSGTISGGSADRLGRLPARVDFETGEIGIGTVVLSEATDSRSIDPWLPDASRLVVAVAALAFDRLRDADEA